MLILKSLQLNNFLSHSETRLEFQPTEMLLLDGKSGSGKSAIVEAIVWAIYNKGRVGSRFLIKRGAAQASVFLELFNKQTNETFGIFRSITNKGKHEVKIYKNEKELAVSGTKAIQEYIENKIVVCSYELFVNSVCYPQENLESFVKQTPAKRKDMILELVRAAKFDEYLEITKTKGSEIKNSLNKLEGKKDNLEFLINGYALAFSDLDGYKKKVLDIEKRLEEIDIQLQKISAAEAEFRILDQRLIDRQQELTRLIDERQQLKIKAKQIQQKIDELSAINPAVVEQKYNRFKEIKPTVDQLEKLEQEMFIWKDGRVQLKDRAPLAQDYETRINEIKQKIIVLQTKKDNKEFCPNCKTEHTCSLIKEERSSEINVLNKDLANFQEKQNIYNKEVGDFKQKMRKYDQAMPQFSQEQQHQLALLRPEMDDLFKYQEEYTKLKTKNELLAEYTKINKQNLEKLTLLDGRISTTKEDVVGLKHKISSNILVIKKDEIVLEKKAVMDDHKRWTEKVALAQKAQEDYKIALIAQENIQKEINQHIDNFAELELLKDAFGPNGIKAVMVDYIIPQLEDRINNILAELSNFRIRLDTQKEAVSGDNLIEGLFISIINEQDEEFDFDNYSGGQKMRIIVAISEGLAELQKMQFRILDEAVVGLDEETVEGFVNTLLIMGKRFDQLVCISHLPAVKSEFGDKIEIINVGGESSINVQN